MATAYKYYLKWDELSIEKHRTIDKDPYPIKRERKFSEFNHNDGNRVERAMYFLLLARTTHIISAKISHYMCIFECLFSAKDAGEISHQLAERVSVYFDGKPSERLENYKLIKDAYGIRSKFLHGQVYTRSIDNQKSISIRIDNLIRRLLVKIFDFDSAIFLQKNNESLENSFKDLIINQRAAISEIEEQALSYLRFK